MIKLIVGLGNPGREYSETRHNVGVWYVNILANRFCASFRKEEKFYGLTACINHNFSRIKLHLLIPTTFMNLSGKAVKAIANFYHINPYEILVAHDELDLPLGVAKFKFGGSSSGHHGLKNIISQLDNNQNFNRLRIGIHHPGEKKKLLVLY